MVYDTTNKVFQVWDGSASQTIANVIRKYKTSTQVITTTTTYADVTASSGSFAFTIAASEVWQVEYVIPLTFTGTGGAKFQITGPSAPTAVAINAFAPIYSVTLGNAVPRALPTVTSFASNIAASDAASASGESSYSSTVAGAAIRIVATIINGSNAGTVTLQAAQNSSDSTTTLGIGSYMRAEKVA